MEFLEAITDESIKKKSTYNIGGEKWHIGKIEGGSQGAIDKYMEKDMMLVPKGQKPSEGPRFSIFIHLTKEDRKVLQSPSDPVMITITRNSSAKGGCKREHGWDNSWDCESHIQGELCKVGDDFLNALSTLKISILKEKLTEMGNTLDAAQPFTDGFKFEDGYLRLEHIKLV